MGQIIPTFIAKANTLPFEHVEKYLHFVLFLGVESRLESFVVHSSHHKLPFHLDTT